MYPLAIYVHTPFCPSKCGYCDFNSYAMDGEIMERTVAATIRQIEQSPHRGRPAKTIFFGGGTPTYLSETQVIRIFEAVQQAHPPIEGAEITSEANPGTVDMPKFAAMRKAGFNRISLGAQSFFEGDLVTLGRVHQSGHIERAVGAAREAGFDNVNLDLMFALPGQTMRAWEHNLDRAMTLQPEHLSLYCLTIEPNTAFYKKHLHGQLILPEDEDQVAMCELAEAKAKQNGYEQYEISNFAKPGRECRHNLCYWHNEEYAAYGPGAVGCLDDEVGRFRYTNLKHPERYCQAIESGEDVRFEKELLDQATQRVEKIMLGLRLNEGFDAADLGINPRDITGLVSKNWLDREGSHLRLTPEGRHFCSEAALALI